MRRPINHTNLLLKKLSKTFWFETILLPLISGLAYLPHITRLTYYRDDWYFLYNALVIGPRALIAVALHTRPIRGPLYALYFSTFGLNPFPYHVVMYMTRLLGGLGVLWLFNLIWPKQRQTNFFLAVLFLLFPGFLWWVAGFEFQPYVLSVGLQAFSIAFTLKAISSGSVAKRLAWTISALLSGWAYLALVEYAIGMELFRLLCVYFYVRRSNANFSLIANVKQTLKTSSLHLLIPGVFLFWYIFLFDNWRSAQDTGTQFARLLSSPTNMIWRLIDIARSVLNVSLFAWVVPFYQNFYGSRLKDILLGFLLTAIVIGLIYLASRFLQDEARNDDPADKNPVSKELFWMGLLGTLGGILPVVLANRIVTFERVSQYTLPASMTGVLLLGSLIYSIFPRKLRIMVLSGIVGLAVLAHHALAVQAATEEKVISDFWWQVVWRAPDIQDGTTLVVSYPGIEYAEGNDVAWGPANFIYADEEQNKMPVNIPIPASRLEQDSILEIIKGNRDFEQTDVIIKNITNVIDYKNQLIISQPSRESCIHALDARWPDLSIYDQVFVHAGARNSKVENIVVTGTPPQPLKYAFGLEPAHDWCFYYQKADLARQSGDWQQVARLGDEVQKLSLHPNDRIEWMPFLQAYAFLNNQKQVKAISTRINAERFYREQACTNLQNMSEYGFALSEDMSNYVNELFCK